MELAKHWLNWAVEAGERQRLLGELSRLGFPIVLLIAMVIVKSVVNYLLGFPVVNFGFDTNIVCQSETLHDILRP